MRHFSSLALVVAAIGIAAAAPARAADPPPHPIVASDSAPPIATTVTSAPKELAAVPWQIRYFESIDAVYAAYGPRGPWPIGTMYPDSDWLDRQIAGKRLVSPQYLAQHANRRPPLAVELPCGHFCIDSVTMNDGVPGDSGWAVCGDPPNVTLAPSVNIKGGWHGFIQNGVISDDCEGRTFPERRSCHPEHAAHADRST